MKIKRWLIIWLCCISGSSVFAEEVALDTALEIGLRSNILIKIEENQTKKSELDSKINDSFLYPELSAFGSYNYSDPRLGVKKDVISGLPPLEFNIGRNDMFSYGLQLRYLLYEGGRRSHLSYATDYLKEASRWSLVDRKRAVESEVRRSYVSVLLLKELVHLADENLNRHIRRRQDAEVALKAGTIAGLELLRVRAEEEDAKIARDEAEDRLKIGETQLSLLLSSSSILTPKGSLQVAARQAIEFELSILSQKDPEFAQLMAASLQKKAADESYQAKKSEELPTVVTGVKAAQSNPYLGQKQFGTEYNAFVQLTVPLFDFGRSSATTEKAKIDANTISLQVEETDRQL
ncbi:MAG: TolC family protein, partial [Leptonema sp. (in: Bacteria)]|nr:TolC family protein [Leptonema sp. (in: bacteria)]